jgi:predicted nucleic acid-binding protein
MVAAVCGWHEHHAAAASAIERRLDRGQRLAVPAHALVETYAVLTRLPPPHRLSPADAWALVKGNFVDHATVVTLGAAAHVKVLDRLAGNGVGGGRSYDAIIGATAIDAGAAELLTFNVKHPDTPGGDIAVIDPAGDTPPRKPR